MAAGTVITGRGIDLFRWLTIRSGIKLEALGLGRSRGLPSCTVIAKRELGVTGNRATILAAVNAHISKLEAAVKSSEIRELA